MAEFSLSKKRKLHPADSVGKKKEKSRKQTVQAASPPPEDAPSSQKRKPRPPNDKGKSRASDHPSEFCVVSASLVLSIPPVFASDLRAGVEEMLDSMVMRHVPSLQGVLLAHSDIRFLSQTATIRGDCPFAVCNVGFDATVWAPRVSMKLVGRIILCSPDHISLLVHRTFNVSIPRHHIPQDQWLFAYGPAENDPEFGEGRDWDADHESRGASDREGEVSMGDPNVQKPSPETREAESSGRWVHHLTGLKLGDPDGYVEFTVIGLTIANEMLSLQGSIQPDPFSPEHIPQPDKGTPFSALSRDETSEVENGVDEDESGSDEDGFQYLAKLVDEANAIQKSKHAKREGERSEERKKRKRQQKSGSVGGENPQHDKAAKKRMKDDAL